MSFSLGFNLIAYQGWISLRYWQILLPHEGLVVSIGFKPQIEKKMLYLKIPQNMLNPSLGAKQCLKKLNVPNLQMSPQDIGSPEKLSNPIGEMI